MSWLSEGHNSGWRERVGPTYCQHKIYTAFQLGLISSAIQQLTDFTLVFALWSLFLHILANCLLLLSLQPSLAERESDGPEGQWERWAQADHKVRLQKMQIPSGTQSSHIRLGTGSCVMQSWSSWTWNLQMTSFRPSGFRLMSCSDFLE